MKGQAHKRVPWYAGFAAVAVLCLLGIWGRGTVAAAAATRVGIPIAIADFDGDSDPDLASVQTGLSGSRNTRYWIAFHLTAGQGQTVGITAPAGGLQIATRDVNGDAFLDLVVTTAWTNQPVAILLNDGLGNFTPSNPSEFQSAFASPPVQWTFESYDIRDATALVLYRCAPGDCRTKDRASPATATGGLLVPNSINASFLVSVLPSIGRAPPV